MGHFSADFYRRRLEDKLAAHLGDDGLVPASMLQTEAALLAVPGDAAFVRQAYRVYLQRDPDFGGLRYFCDMAEKLGRQAVVNEIRNSDEGRRRGGAPHIITPEPVAPPEPFDVPALGNMSAPGNILELTDLLAISDDRGFIAAAYLGTLGRKPDPDGFEHHLDRLRQGDARAMLLKALAASAEASEQGRQFTWEGRPWPARSLRARARAAISRALPGGERWRRRT